MLKKLVESKKNLSEEKVFDFTLYLVDGLKFLHERKIIHRDIKPK
jgi:serine/threonine protein kinase